ncbi:MAG: hypothetical protein AB7C89_01600 [Intestinibacillus sp.]
MDEKKNEASQPEEHKRQSKRFLAVYIIGLFSVALVLILLSYLTQVRADRQLASKDSELNAQINATEGAVQKIEALQATAEEQRKQLEEQKKVLDSLANTLDAGAGDDLAAAAQLTEDRYVALDALQQARRMLEADNKSGAKTVAEKMLGKYGASRLLPPSSDVLLGMNAVEFQKLCEAVDAQMPAE